MVLAFCVVRPRQLLVLEEAQVGLDAPGGERFQELLLEPRRQKSWTVLQVSHDLEMVPPTIPSVRCGWPGLMGPMWCPPAITMPVSDLTVIAVVIVRFAGFLLALVVRASILSPSRFRVAPAEAGSNWPSAGQGAG